MCVKAAGWLGVAYVMVEVIKLFVQFTNLSTLYAVETSSAEAPRGQLSTSSLTFFLKKGAALVSLVGVVSQQLAAASSSRPAVLLGCDGPQGCS